MSWGGWCYEVMVLYGSLFHGICGVMCLVITDTSHFWCVWLWWLMGLVNDLDGSYQSMWWVLILMGHVILLLMGLPFMIDGSRHPSFDGSRHYSFDGSCHYDWWVMSLLFWWIMSLWLMGHVTWTLIYFDWQVTLLDDGTGHTCQSWCDRCQKHPSWLMWQILSITMMWQVAHVHTWQVWLIAVKILMQISPPPSFVQKGEHTERSE